MIDPSSFAPTLKLGADGIWKADGCEAVSYPERARRDCAALEDASFWFRHRNECILAAVRAFPASQRSPLFDVGGGNGCVAAALARDGHEVVLVEPGYVGACTALRRGVPTVIQATLATARLRPGSIDAAGIFDVLEHVDDDVAFLRLLRDGMRRGARLYITVPAWDLLWSQADVASGHFRRYTPASLRRVLQVADFTVDFSTCFFRPLPLPIFVSRSLPYRLGFGVAARRPASDHAGGGRLARRLLARVLAPEVAHIAARRRMRFGGSVLVVASAT